MVFLRLARRCQFDLLVCARKKLALQAEVLRRGLSSFKHVAMAMWRGSTFLCFKPSALLYTL